MITIGYSTRVSNPEFIERLKKTSGYPNVQVIEKINNGKKSLSQVYNEILNESKTEIVVICHDDILFEKPYWGKRLFEQFEKNPNFGILGVAGTKFLPKSGMWWEIQSEMIGQVYHQENGKKWLSEYSKPVGSKIIETVLVDGLFLGINKKNIKSKFDESYNGFHFYDVSFCFNNYIQGVKIGVVSNIPLTHLSVGRTNDQWEFNRTLFSEKNKNNLPLMLNSEFPILEINPKIPVVSVVIPIYNYGVIFNRTLISVFDSTYKNLEIVIVDDGSTNDYVILKLKSLENHPNIKIIRQENSGPSSARNNGIKNSTGELILPLDSDDMIHPDYIQSCVNIIKNNKNVSPVYCDTYHIGQMEGVETRPEWSMDRLIQGPFIVNCSMFHRTAFDITGGYDESLFGWEDYDLWIRMGLNGYVGKRIPKPLFTYFHHENDGTVSTVANKNISELHQKILNKNFDVVDNKIMI